VLDVFTIAHICTYRGLENPIFVLGPRLVGTIRRCLNDGRKSDATIWQGDHWYMLWHHQKELALHIPILKRVVGYFEIFTVIRWFFLIPLLIISGPYISEPERKSAEPL